MVLRRIVKVLEEKVKTSPHPLPLSYSEEHRIGEGML
jgi:hypothetical protein